MDPAPQQVGVDAVSHGHGGHRDARLLRSLHCLRLELGAVDSPTAAWRCLVHSAYVPIKSLMDTSILGLSQRINMTSLAAYDLPAEERLRERRTRAAPVAQALYRWLLEFRPKVKSQSNVARAARCTSSLLGADGRTIDALRLLKNVGAVLLLDEFTRCDGSARSGAKPSKSVPACSSFLFSQRACCNGCTATLCRQSVDFVAGHLQGSGSVPSCAWDKPPLERKPHIPTCLLTAKFKAHSVQTAYPQSVRRSAMPVGLRSSTGPMSQDGRFSCRDGELNALGETGLPWSAPSVPVKSAKRPQPLARGEPL